MVLAIACRPVPADARDEQTSRIDVDATSLPAAIAELSRETSVSIGTEGSLPQVATPPLHGRMSITHALKKLLHGSGYEARRVGARAWRIERARQDDGTHAAERPRAVTPLDVAPPEPIIVTGSKRAFDLQNLPMAVSVSSFDRDQTIATATAGSSWTVEQNDGISLTGLGPGRNRMFLRGIADSAFNGETASTVAVVLDDARLTYSAPDPDIRLVDVDRVEVFKGPQGSLYGTGALGGIYHIVTRSPDFADTSLVAMGGLSGVTDGSPGWSGSLVANLPLVEDRIALRLVGYAAREGGWIETGSRSDSNSYSVLGGRAALGVDLGGGWLIEGKGLVQLLESRDSQYVYDKGSRSRPEQLAEPHDNDLYHGALRLTRDSGPVRITLSSGLTVHEVTDTIDATQGADQFGLVNPGLLDDSRKFRVWDTEARVNGGGERFEWLLGLSRIEARQTQNSVLSDVSGSASLMIDDDRRTVSDSAIFGEATIPLVECVRLTVGGRLFRTVSRETKTLPNAVVSERRVQQDFTPTVSLAWQPRPTRLLYMRYGSAVRPGGVDITETGTLEPLKDDELMTLEAGWREETLSGGHVELGLYGSYWRRIQSDQLGSDGLIETSNVGNGRILGVEASATMPFGPDWRAILGANYTNAILIDAAPGLESDDLRLPVVPTFTLRGSVLRQFLIGTVPASVDLNLRYVGPARLSFDPALDRPMGNVLETGLRASATFGDMTVELSGENLLDLAGDTFAYGNPLRFAQSYEYTPQRPRTVLLSVRASF
jgi:iron complex outermembrane receptor protein